MGSFALVSILCRHTNSARAATDCLRREHVGTNRALNLANENRFVDYVPEFPGCILVAVSFTISPRIKPY